MGIASIGDVLDHVSEEGLYNRLSRCRAEHEQLQGTLQELLGQYREGGKDPSPIAKGMSWMKTNVKLGMEAADSTIADLMTDGCNMGVKSLSRYLNQYAAASPKAKNIAGELIRLEEQLAADLRTYL